MGNSVLIVCVFQTHILDALNYLIIIREHSNIMRSKEGEGCVSQFFSQTPIEGEGFKKFSSVINVKILCAFEKLFSLKPSLPLFKFIFGLLIL